MIWLRWVTRRGANTLIFAPEELLFGKVFIGSVSPDLLAYALVEILGEGFCEAISDSLNHDGVIAVAVFLELFDHGVDTNTGSTCKQTHVISVVRGDKIAKCEMRSITLLLLSQHVENGSLLHDNTIVVSGFAWENSDDSIGSKLLVVDYILEHGLRVVPEFFSLRTSFRVVENLWIVTVGVLSADLPCAEEWEPIDIR